MNIPEKNIRIDISVNADQNKYRFEIGSIKDEDYLKSIASLIVAVYQLEQKTYKKGESL